MTEHDTTCTDEIVCPYCGYEQGDSWELDLDCLQVCKSVIEKNLQEALKK